MAAVDYVSTMPCDCIIFMDEFEKNFAEGNQEILQMMDGVYNSEFRKIFLLTTNELNVNDNLLGRPSRIRYVKQFGNLDKATVEEYLDENLADKSAKKDIMDFIDTLTISTIDILKSIVNEVNIHGIDGFIHYREFFNVILIYEYVEKSFLCKVSCRTCPVICRRQYVLSLKGSSYNSHCIICISKSETSTPLKNLETISMLCCGIAQHTFTTHCCGFI